MLRRVRKITRELFFDWLHVLRTKTALAGAVGVVTAGVDVVSTQG